MASHLKILIDISGGYPPASGGGFVGLGTWIDIEGSAEDTTESRVRPTFRAGHSLRPKRDPIQAWWEWSGIVEFEVIPRPRRVRIQPDIKRIRRLPPIMRVARQRPTDDIVNPPITARARSVRMDRVRLAPPPRHIIASVRRMPTYATLGTRRQHATQRLGHSRTWANYHGVRRG